MQKIIHNIWIQGYDNLPDQTKDNHIKIKKLNPDWEFIIWDNNMILELLEKYPKIKNIYKNVDKYYGIINNDDAKSHIAIYVILKEYGGLYYDLDFECIISFNELFDANNNQNQNIKNTIYVASSKIEWLDYIYPFQKPKYCSCFIALERENPLMEKVIQRVLTANNKYDICNALSIVLQNVENESFDSESTYHIVVVNKVNGYYECLKKKSEHKSSLWLLQFLNSYYKQFLLVILIFVIMFGVDKISKYNTLHSMNINQGQNNLLFPFGSLQQSQPIQPSLKQKQNKFKRENRKRIT